MTSRRNLHARNAHKDAQQRRKDAKRFGEAPEGRRVVHRPRLTRKTSNTFSMIIGIGKRKRRPRAT